MIRVTWTGAAGLRFETERELILIDPYYTRVGIFRTLFKPIAPDPAALAAALPDPATVSAIVVGHTHSDHAMDVPWIAARTPGPVVGSPSLDTLMSLSGQPGRTRVCTGGETVGLTESASVTMIRSAHGLVTMGKAPFAGEIRPSMTLPMKASGYRVGTVFAPKLELAGVRFLHVGSANFEEETIQGHTCDVLFLCVPGWKRRKGYPQRLIETTRPATVVLFHFDNFSKPHVPGSKTRPMPLSDLPGIVRAIQGCAPTVAVRVPDVGEVLVF